jgi:hypothetical protein
MRINLKSVIGAIIGCATAGGWLVVDLLLPEPIGDYLLFILMGVVNMAIGWQVGRLLTKLRRAEKGDVPISGEGTEDKFKLES